MYNVPLIVKSILSIFLYRRRSTLEGSEPKAAQGQGQMQQQMVPVQDSYMQNRAEALQNVESTIVELSNIFSQLATMVAQQGEMAIRCDSDRFLQLSILLQESSLFIV
jgi:syntaxin 5